MLLLNALVITGVPLTAGFMLTRRLLTDSGMKLPAWPAILSLLLAICIGYFTATGVSMFNPIIHVTGNLLVGLLVAVYVSWRSNSNQGTVPTRSA